MAVGKTLEHYLHEVVYALQYTTVEAAQERQLQLVAQAAAAFARPPPAPAPALADRIQPLGVGGRLCPMGTAFEAAEENAQLV